MGNMMDLNYFLKKLKKAYGDANPNVGFTFYTKDRKEIELYCLTFNELEYHKGYNFLSLGTFKITGNQKLAKKITFRKVKEMTVESMNISKEALAERFKSYYSIDEKANEGLKDLSSKEILDWMCEIVNNDIKERAKLLEDMILRCNDNQLRKELATKYLGDE